MKKLLETIASTVDLMVWIIFVAGCFFVFKGEPDLWDKWHAEAMGASCIKTATPLRGDSAQTTAR